MTGNRSVHYAKCKVCGYRLGDGVAKCPMCGMAGSTVAGNISPDLNLPKYACPACKAQIIGEHRNCTNCGADLKKAAQAAQNAQSAQENKCVQCGAILPAGAKFCNECGAKQEEIPAETGNAEAATVQLEEMQETEAESVPPAESQKTDGEKRVFND